MKCQVLILMLLGLITSCFNDKNFMVLSNTERSKLGIPLLDSDWIPYRKGTGIVEYSNPNGSQSLKEKIPVHFSKTISFDENGKVIAENDIFYGSDVFQTVDGTNREKVSFTYYMKPTEIADSLVKDWFCTYSGKLLKMNRESNDHSETDLDMVRVQIISKSQADEILDRWGLK